MNSMLSGYLKKGLLAAALFGASGCNSETAQTHIDKANEYFKQGDRGAAVIELKNAIQLEPENITPRDILGRYYLRTGNFASAEKELLRAYKLGSQDETLPALIGLTYIHRGMFDDLISFATDLTPSSPQMEAEINAVLMMAAIDQQDFETVELLKKKIDVSGVTTNIVKRAMARYHVRQDDFVDAFDLYDDILKTDPNDGLVWLMRGHANYASGQFVEAAEDYKKAISYSPDASYYPVFYAGALIAGQQFDEARPYVDRLLEAAPNHIKTNEMKAAIAYADRDFELAKTHSERAMLSGSPNIGLSMIAGIANYELGNYDPAGRHFARVLEFYPENKYAKRLFSLTQLQLGDVEAAVDALEAIDIENAEDSEFLSRASVELSRLGMDAKAVSLAKKAAASGNQNDLLRLGVVKLASSDKSAISDIRSVIDASEAKKGPQIALAYGYLRLGDVDAATKVIEKLKKEYPDDLSTMTVTGMLAQTENDMEQAKAWYKKVLDSDANAFPATLFNGIILQNEEKRAEAHELFIKAKKAVPANETVNEYLIRNAYELGKMDEVIALLKEQVEVSPGSAELNYHLASAYQAAGDMESARKQLESVDETVRNAPIWRVLSILYYQERNLQDAEKALDQWIIKSPTDTRPYFSLIDLHMAAGNEDRAIAIISRGIARFPDDGRFHAAQIEALRRQQMYARALRTADTMPDVVRNEPVVRRAEARVLMDQKKYDEALGVLNEVYAKQPSIEAANEIVDVNIRRGDRQKAIAFIDESYNKFGRPAEALLLRKAEILLGSEQEDEAIKVYEDLISRYPNDLIVLNNLAWLYLDAGKVERGCELAGNAFNIAENQPEIQDTFGYCKLKSGDPQSAVIC